MLLCFFKCALDAFKLIQSIILMLLLTVFHCIATLRHEINNYGMVILIICEYVNIIQTKYGVGNVFKN